MRRRPGPDRSVVRKTDPHHGYVVGRTTDLARAEAIVGDAYLPHRLDRVERTDALDMGLVGVQFGSLFAGRLGYGTALRMRTIEMTNLHVNIPLSGRAVSSVGHETLCAEPGEAAVFTPGATPEIYWSRGCEQLCLMVPPATVTLELEQLLGRHTAEPLQWAFLSGDQTGLTRALKPAIRLMTAELESPSSITHYPAAARHVEGLVVSSLLLGQPHNYTDRLLRPADAAPRGVIARAVELIQEFPEEAWTVTRLAHEVHVSVRTLQTGFRSQLGEPPSVYLRRVRLAKIREVLASTPAGATTVHAVATRFGFLHMGRFAATYKATFHESPSITLNRPRE